MPYPRYNPRRGKLRSDTPHGRRVHQLLAGRQQHRAGDSHRAQSHRARPVDGLDERFTNCNVTGSLFATPLQLLSEDVEPMLNEINQKLWETFEKYLRRFDFSYYDLFSLLFLKCVSDIASDYQSYPDAYHVNGFDQGIKIRVDLTFHNLVAKRNADNITDEIRSAFVSLEEANAERLSGLFSQSSFLRPEFVIQHVTAIRSLLQDMNDPIIDLRPYQLGGLEYLGEIWDYLLGKITSDYRYRAEAFSTPAELNTLIANLLQLQPSESICDPFVRTGSLLIECIKNVKDHPVKIWGQEINLTNYGICIMNLIMHDIDITQQNIKRGDTLNSPQLTAGGKLMQFDVIVSTPPFGLRNWKSPEMEDAFERFWRGVPPQSIGDYAFISHIVETMSSDPESNGRAAIVVLPGVLFRGGIEGRIRRKLIEENLIEAVIALPKNLFYSTSLQSVILILKANRSDNRILFIDASRETKVKSGRNQLLPEHISKIVSAYESRSNIGNFAYLASIEEIVLNEYNLAVNRYVFAYRFSTRESAFSTGPGVHDVFISYSRKNIELKREVVDALLNAGLRVWDDEAHTLDVGIPGWEKTIEHAIEDSNCVVVLLSPEAKQSDWVRLEIGYAIHKRKPIFPVVVSGDPQDSIPITLVNTQYALLNPEDQNSLRSLWETLQAKVGIKLLRTPYIYDLQQRQPNWNSVKLSEIARITRPPKANTSGSEDIQEVGEFPVYGLSGLKGYRNTYDFEGEYLLVPTLRTASQDHLAGNAWKPENRCFSVTSSEIAIIQPNSSEILLDFLLYYFWITDLDQFSQTALSARNRINLNSLTICLPPLTIQEEIVARLNSEMMMAEKRREELATRIEILAARKIGVIHREFLQDLDGKP